MSGGSLEFCGNVGVRRIRLRDSWLGVGFNFRAIKRLWADPGFVDLGHRTASFLAFLAKDIGAHTSTESGLALEGCFGVYIGSWV